MASNEIYSIWILGDQLLANHSALEAAASEVGIQHCRVALIQSTYSLKHRPYHKRKLVLLLSAMRHYQRLLESRGFEVDYINAPSFLSGLQKHISVHNPSRLLTMASADYKVRQFQQSLHTHFELGVQVVENKQFLVEQFNPIPEPEQDKRYVMEYFYRDMRKHFDILMTPEDEPEGGEWNFDKLNRERLPKDVNIPAQPMFEIDDITQMVIDEVATHGYGVGSLEKFNLAVTHEQAQQALDLFIEERLENFGPYEDAMAERDATLFHSVLSPYLNIGLLEPLAAVKAVEKAYYENRAPINSVEGFIRQVLGWREFMYWQYWRQMPQMIEKNQWQANRPMPDMFWSGDTNMHCIQQVYEHADKLGYAHHIERLMIVTNYCTLAGIDPQAVVDWFKAYFIDAYDWVMQPNVVGMGLNADGGIVATKPYISSANYINKMSDYCGSCALNRKARTGEDACPFNFLYWNFLIAHEETLRENPRLGRNVLGLRHLDEDERVAVQAQAAAYLDNLAYYETEITV